MATRKKVNKKPGKGRRAVLRAFAALLGGLALLAAVAAINADVVRLRHAEVLLPDLPAAFDGVTILYASDLDLCGLNTADKCGGLFQQLQEARPDILLLGGDYTASSLLDALNRSDEATADQDTARQKRRDFFYYIGSFDAPLGKYAIASPQDPDWSSLKRQLTEAGIVPLINDRACIESGGARLWLAGICENSGSLNSAGAAFDRSECVIAAAYGPDPLPVLMTSEARDGGQWADLVLCGGTHGGQVRLFGRTLLPLSQIERRYLSGWRLENGLPIMTTQGVGCEGLNLRLGTEPEVWLITLRRAGSTGNVL